MIFDLDQIAVAPNVKEAWLGATPYISVMVARDFPDLPAKDVPDELFESCPEGHGKIFITVSHEGKVREYSIPVAKGDWALSVLTKN